MKQYDLMPYDTYSSKEYPFPYAYHLSKDEQHLYFFGSRHTYNPEDEQISKLEDFWNDFLLTTTDTRRIVLVEGGARTILGSKIEAIETGSEIQYVAFLAAQDDVVVESPEPPASYWFQTLADRFSKDAVAYYDFARVCYQWNQMDTRSEFETYISSFLEANTKNSGWDNYDFSIEHMKEIHQQIFGSTFKEDDENFFHDIINPTTSFSIINEVSRADDEGVRDIYILSEIEKHWKEGKSLFIIYGQQHAVILENALKKLTN